MKDHIDQKFRAAWSLLGCGGGLEVLKDLKVRWSEPQRAYRTEEHLQHCLDLLSEVSDLAKSYEQVLIAVWFHDAVYDPQAVDNERKSAALLRDRMTKNGAEGDVIAGVERLVLSTEHGSVEPSQMTSDEHLLSDIDLSILGSERDVFDNFERQIRREYAWVEEKHYKAARRNVLKSFQERDAIFHFPELREVFEQRARSNLAWAVETLIGE